MRRRIVSDSPIFRNAVYLYIFFSTRHWAGKPLFSAFLHFILLLSEETVPAIIYCVRTTLISRIFWEENSKICWLLFEKYLYTWSWRMIIGCLMGFCRFAVLFRWSCSSSMIVGCTIRCWLYSSHSRFNFNATYSLKIVCFLL